MDPEGREREIESVPSCPHGTGCHREKGGERLKGGGPPEKRIGGNRRPTIARALIPFFSSPGEGAGIHFHTSTSPSLQSSPIFAKGASATRKEGRKSMPSGPRPRNAHAHAHCVDSGGPADPPAPQHALLAEAESRLVHAAFKKSGGGCQL